MGWGEGWEVLVRLTPRPLTARPWRVCNWPGALNAVVAGIGSFVKSPNPGHTESVRIDSTDGLAVR